MRALILVDLQNDFMPGGALAVPGGDGVVPAANRLSEVFASPDLVVASQDWHPADHGSFASQHPDARPGDVIELDGLRQELWPDHCVRGHFRRGVSPVTRSIQDNPRLPQRLRPGHRQLQHFL